MFHRFSVLSTTGDQVKEPLGRADVAGSKNGGPVTTIHQNAKRQKTTRACDRCRAHRTKCDEQKPCLQCVSAKAECITIRPTPGPQRQLRDSSQPSSGKVSEQDTSTHTPTGHIRLTAQDGATSQSSGPRENRLSEPHETPLMLDSGDMSDFGDGLFPQLPHSAVPLTDRINVVNMLSDSERRFHLRLFWDVCHPMAPLLHETEFAELEALPSPMLFDDCSVKDALVISMIALGMQHSYATGLAGRVLGLRHSFSQQPSGGQRRGVNGPYSELGWPGFALFDSARASMRPKMEVDLDGLRCHVLMTLYLIRGNAFCDAYNLLGITIRKAYIAKLHRSPPYYLPEPIRTARMQLWSTLLTLDIQCSLQLDMPTAIQNKLFKLPVPAEEGLSTSGAFPRFPAECASPHACSIHLAHLAVVVNDAKACVSIADLTDKINNKDSATVIEHHAAQLSFALQTLEAWYKSLPTELRLPRRPAGPGQSDVISLEFDFALPLWLQRQIVLIELRYHDAQVLLQRPFIRLCSLRNNDAPVISTNSQGSCTQLLVAGAFSHATTIIETIFIVCSSSDLLYGWSEVLQPLWNATLTVVAYTYANQLGLNVSHVLDLLMQAHSILECFASKSMSAQSAQSIVESLTHALQTSAEQCPGPSSFEGLLDWDLVTSLFEMPQTPTVG